MIFAKMPDGSMTNICEMDLNSICPACGAQTPFELDDLLCDGPMTDDLYECTFLSSTLCDACTAEYMSLKDRFNINVRTYINLKGESQHGVDYYDGDVKEYYWHLFNTNVLAPDSCIAPLTNDLLADWFVADAHSDQLPTAFRTPYDGVVYILECNNCIKIGQTTKLAERIKTLVRTAEMYGDFTVNRVWFTRPHTNFQENERILHKHFAPYRKSATEVFMINPDEAIKKLPSLSLQNDQIQMMLNAKKRSDALVELLLHSK